jgi:hypothetical protein
MLRFFRSLCAVAVVLALALPAAAEPTRDGLRRDIVKVIRTWFVRVFGDGLSDPRP